MGYELMNIVEEECPCGKSITVTSSYTDDWNRRDSTYEMLCDTCRGEYIQYDNYWVRRTDWLEKEVVQQKYDVKKSSTERMASLQLTKEWHQYFAHIKTKQALYLALIENWDWNLGVERYAIVQISKKRFSDAINKMSIKDSINHLLVVMLNYTNVYQVMNKISSTNKEMIAELNALTNLLEEKRAAERKMFKNKH